MKQIIKKVRKLSLSRKITALAVSLSLLGGGVAVALLAGNTRADAGGSYKDAWYDGVPGRGTITNPVPVEQDGIIEYKIHAAGDGVNYYAGSMTTPEVEQPNRFLMSNFGNYPILGGGNGGNAWYYELPGRHAVSNDGKMTLDSNYDMEIGGPISTGGPGMVSNVVVGFTPEDNEEGIPYKMQYQGQGPPLLPYNPPCVATQHSSALENYAAGNLEANKDLIRPDERYIKITFNELSSDIGYLMDFYMSSFGQFQPWDMIITIRGCNIFGDEKIIEINRSNLISGSQSGPNDLRPMTTKMPLATEYSDPNNNNLPYVFPIDGRIEVTFTRMHNSRHDGNMYIGAGLLTERKVDPVIRVVDYLPAGLEYVPGSSGEYEGNMLTPQVQPDGRTKLVWKFVTLPPEGYDISFEAKVLGDGLFQNYAEVEYLGAASALPDERTNDTWHLCGDMPTPYLVLTKTGDKSTVDIGDIVTYTVNVKNTGFFDAAQVVLTDELPPGMDYIPGTAKIDGAAAPGASFNGATKTLSVPIGYVKGFGTSSVDCLNEYNVSFQVLVNGLEIAESLNYRNQAQATYRARVTVVVV